MPLENVHTPDENLEKKEEKSSTNELEYKNPSKQITEENDQKVNKEKEAADDILPEEQEKKRLELAKKVNIMEEGATKDSYMKVLGITKVAIDEEDRTTANNWLKSIEEKIGGNNIKDEIPETKTTKDNNEKKDKDITKDMQKLGKTEKIDENNYIITLDIPRTNLSNIQEGNIKEIENKGFTVKYIGDDSGKITQLKIISQNS